MIAQLDATVARPEIAWDGLLPILTLGFGALLLVLFRSLMKQLPKAAAEQAVPAIGGLTVIAMTGMYFLERRAGRGFARSAA